MDPKNLPGSIKAAILIQAAGRTQSEKILGMLNQDERQLVKEHLSQMGDISPDLVEKVAKEFIQMASSKTVPPQIQGPPEPTKEKNEKEPADSPNKETPTPSTLKTLEADRLLELVRDEHPQTIAMILIHVRPDVASVVLANLPDETKAEVGYRIAVLDKVGAGIVDEVAMTFQDIIKDSEASVSDVRGGADPMANLLNLMDAMSGEIILNAIEEDDEELAAQIKQKMFTFEDITMVDNQGLQKVLRRVESAELATALKAASEDVKQKVFSNMSERAAEMVKEEIDVLGAVRMSDVENAQYTITRIVQEMADQGEVVIAGRGGEQLIV